MSNPSQKTPPQPKTASETPFLVWEVKESKAAKKGKELLRQNVRDAYDFLVAELKTLGPVRGAWPNYSKVEQLGPNHHHCHLQRKGKPTMVAVWEADKLLKTILITYVGSRENAPY